MARRRPKKGDPELLLVSFCDIITITTAALFMAMVVTIQEAVRVPVYKPVPMTVPTNKAPMFFECRNNEVYYLDKDALDTQVATLLSTIDPSVRSGDMSQFMKLVASRNVGNKFYKVNPSYLLVGVMALDPKPNEQGDTIPELDAHHCRLLTALSQMDKANTYAAFLVRDDSFPAFRRARQLADEEGFDTGWELLAANEPIKFGAGGSLIKPQ